MSGLSDAGRKFVSYLLGQTVTISVHAAALGSALYVFTQLLPEENMVLSDFVYDSETPLETSEDGKLYKCAGRFSAGDMPQPYCAACVVSAGQHTFLVLHVCLMSERHGMCFHP